jgi:hypothetical protein
LSCVLLAGIAVAQAHEEGREHAAHEHGVARLDIAVEKSSVDIDLDSPAVNFVGFEHEPGDSKEKATLDKAVADLNQGDKLMAFSPAAQCTQKRARVTSGLLDHEEEMDHDHAAKEEHHHDDEAKHDHGEEGDADEHDHEHSDINVTWELTCAHPESLREVDFSALFRRFPGTHKLRVQAALPGGQTATELTPDAPKLKM